MAGWKDAGEIITNNPDLNVFTRASARLALKSNNKINPTLCSDVLLEAVIAHDESKTRRDVLEAFTTTEDLERVRTGGRTEEGLARVACIKGCKGVVLLQDGTKVSFCKNTRL